MHYLVDTNVLLRLADPNHPRHRAARAAVRTLQSRSCELRIASQNGIEFRNVASRPADRNGLGLAPEQADLLLSFFEQIFHRLPEIPTMYEEWRRLVAEHQVSGIQVHDAHLVAAMKVHGIHRILTFNVRDFTRYSNIGLLATDPEDLREGAPDAH